MRSIIVVFMSGILILLLLISCDTNPSEEPEFEGVPGPEFNIPDSLVSQSGKDRAAPDSESVFEPFRLGLYFAQECIEIVKTIIETLNEHTIPDNGEFVSGEGELIVITTDENREYKTMIEVYTGEEAVPEDKYMQISYTKGTNKGEAVFNIEPKQPGSEVDMVKIFYDGTGDDPVLKGWLTFNFVAEDYVVYPVSVYFNGFKNSDTVTIEGGVAYHYFFDNDETYGSDNTYADNHVYMFKAMADTVQEIAIVHLYFPQKDEPLSVIEDWEISESMLYILFTWLNLPGNGELKSDLEVLYGSPIATKEDLYDLLDQYRENPAVVDLIFILELDNPIAYSAANGYEANSNVPSQYTDIGDIGSVTFSEEPSDIFSMEITF